MGAVQAEFLGLAGFGEGQHAGDADAQLAPSGHVTQAFEALSIAPHPKSLSAHAALLGGALLGAADEADD